MNKLYNLMFYALLSGINVAFGMESEMQLPKVAFFAQVKDGFRSFSNLKESSINFQEKEKNGHCRLRQEKDKFFIQEIDAIAHTPIGKAIEIEQPNEDDLTSAMSANPEKKPIVAQLNGKNYLVQDNHQIYNQCIIPYREIVKQSLFLVKQESAFRQILNDKNTAPYTKKVVPTESLSGIISGFFHNRLLIELYQNSQHLETIGLLVENELQNSISNIKDENIFARYYEKDEQTEKFVAITKQSIQKESKPSDANMLSVKQISGELATICVKPSSIVHVFEATTTQNILSTTGREFIEVTFNIAGTQYIRFVQKCGNIQNQNYVKIEDIIPGAYVHFQYPQNKAQYLDILGYLANNATHTQNNDETVSSKDVSTTENINAAITQLLQKINNQLIPHSYTCLSQYYFPIIFLPQSQGSIETKNGESILTITVANNETLKITLNNIEENKIIGNSPTTLVILRDENGASRIVVKCAPNITNSSIKPNISTLTNPNNVPIQPQKNPKDFFAYITRLCNRYKWRFAGTVAGVSIIASMIYFLNSMK